MSYDLELLLVTLVQKIMKRTHSLRGAQLRAAMMSKSETKEEISILSMDADHSRGPYPFQVAGCESDNDVLSTL